MLRNDHNLLRSGDPIRYYNPPHAEKDILDGLHAARAGGRFPASFLVGLRRHHPYPFRRMVGCLPQRLVLRRQGSMSEIALVSVDINFRFARRLSAITENIVAWLHRF